MILNTKFRKRFEKQWTHEQGGMKRIIDYFLCESRPWFDVRNLEASSDILLGDDHRCLGMDVRIQAPVGRSGRRAKQNCKASLRGWQQNPNSDFCAGVEAKITDTVCRNDFLIQSLEDRCKQIEDILLEAAYKALPTTAPTDDEDLQTLKCKIRELIAERRGARNQRDKVSEKKLGKQVQRELAALTAARKRGKIEKILREFKGLKRIAGVKAGGKRCFIGTMLDTDGVQQTDRQAIADVFADFYADLYHCPAGSGGNGLHNVSGLMTEVPAVTTEELEGLLKKMAGGKSEDSSGMVV